MKRFFITIAFLSVVVVMALVAHSHSQDENRLKIRLPEERNEEIRAYSETKANVEAHKAQTLAEKTEAHQAAAEAEEATAKHQKDKHATEYVALERKFVELHRLIADLHRGGQPDRAAQLQKRALEIAQQLRKKGKDEAASKQLDSLIVSQGAGPVRRVVIEKQEVDKRRENNTEKRSIVQQVKEKVEATRRIAEVLADRQREVVKKLKREIHERFNDQERREKDLSIEERIHQLRESGRLEEAKRMLLELRKHLEREHGEHRQTESHEREIEREIQRARERERERERHWQDGEPLREREAGSRVHHLRQAAEHLQAAGFHEDAERAMHHAERLEQRRAGHDAHAEHLERKIHEMGIHVRQVAERLERLESLFERLVHHDEEDGKDFDEEEEKEDGEDDDEDGGELEEDTEDE